MRRGRALLPHPDPIPWGDDDHLVTRQAIMFVTGHTFDVVRRRVPAVACHVSTRNVLVSNAEATTALASLTPRNEPGTPESLRR